MDSLGRQSGELLNIIGYHDQDSAGAAISVGRISPPSLENEATGAVS